MRSEDFFSSQPLSQKCPCHAEQLLCPLKKGLTGSSLLLELRCLQSAPGKMHSKPEFQLCWLLIAFYWSIYRQQHQSFLESRQMLYQPSFNTCSCIWLDRSKMTFLRELLRLVRKSKAECYKSIPESCSALFTSLVPQQCFQTPAIFLDLLAIPQLFLPLNDYLLLASVFFFFLSSGPQSAASLD